MTELLTVVWFGSFIALLLIAILELLKILSFHRHIRVHSPDLYEELGKPHLLQSNSINIFKDLRSFIDRRKAIDTERAGDENVKKAQTILLLWKVFNSLFLLNLVLFFLIFVSR